MRPTTTSRCKGTILFVFAMGMVFTTLTASLSVRLLGPPPENQELASVEKSLVELRYAAKVDRQKEVELLRILEVINRYNRSLPDEVKNRTAEAIYEASIKYENLDVDLICATITHETAHTWRPDIRSPAGAMGLMQIMPATGKFLADLEGIRWTRPEEVLYDPVRNIRLGTRYLSSLIDMYQLEGGLAAYNGGERRAMMWLAHGRDDQVLWKETRTYVPAILRLYNGLRN